MSLEDQLVLRGTDVAVALHCSRIDLRDTDPIERRVYGLLGVPVDADTHDAVLHKVRVAITKGTRLFVSTVNLNFIVLSQDDEAFRRSLHASDLCTVDGMPVIWLGKALNIPLHGRVAGSDLFEALKTTKLLGRSLRGVLFGGPEGVAQAAASRINSGASYLRCVAAIYPGFGTIGEMSSPQIISEINRSEGDLLSVSLGAQKGQAWLLQNHTSITVPVRIHLGATINFQAGVIARAPKLLRTLGFEWLWRIKEEPRLFSRYWMDGCKLLYLFARNVLPLAIYLRWNARRFADRALHVRLEETSDHIKVIFSGSAIERNLGAVSASLRTAVESGKRVLLDMTDVDTIDTRFMGLAVSLKHQMSLRGSGLEIISANARVRRLLWLNRFDWLLNLENQNAA